MYDYSSFIIGANIRVRLLDHFWTDTTRQHFVDYLIRNTSDNLGVKLEYIPVAGENNALVFKMIRPVYAATNIYPIYKNFLLQYNLNNILSKQEIDFLNNSKSDLFINDILLIGDHIRIVL